MRDSKQDTKHETEFFEPGKSAEAVYAWSELKAFRALRQSICFKN
jgi:hypothetical protein